MLEFSSNISENSFVTARSDSPRFWKSARASLTAMFGFPDEDSEFEEEEEEGGVELTQADLASVKALRHRLVGIMEYSGEEPESRLKSLDLSATPLEGIPGAERFIEDSELVRFVRAKKLLDESEAMFREAMDFRRDHVKLWNADVTPTGSFGAEQTKFMGLKEQGKVSEIPDWWLFLDEHWPMKSYGKDDQGLPVFWVGLGQLDCPGCVQAVGMDSLCRYVTMLNDHFLDETWKASKALTRERRRPCAYTGGCVLVDLDGLGLHQMSQLHFFKTYVSIVKNLHPERMRKSFVVRAPWTFSRLWKGVASLLDPRTVERLTILGTRDSLQPVWDGLGRHNVPEFLGGTCTEIKCTPCRRSKARDPPAGRFCPSHFASKPRSSSASVAERELERSLSQP